MQVIGPPIAPPHPTAMVEPAARTTPVFVASGGAFKETTGSGGGGATSGCLPKAMAQDSTAQRASAGGTLEAATALINSSHGPPTGPFLTPSSPPRFRLWIFRYLSSGKSEPFLPRANFPIPLVRKIIDP